MTITRRTVSSAALSACVALSALLGACAGPAPAPPAMVRPVARPVPARPLPPPTPTDWHDLPASPGDWQWRREGRTSVARFGDPVRFSLVCDPPTGTIRLVRHEPVGAAARVMTVRTTSLSRGLAISSDSDGAVASLAARDPLLDAMAYSRGRFAIEVPGTAPLYLPSWPEVSRVIEDCRLPPIAPPAQP